MTDTSARQPETGREAPHPAITTIVFDFDDTLVNSYAARLDALQRVFTAAGIHDPTAEAFVRDMRGRQLEDTLRPLEEREGLRPLDLFQGYRRTYWTKKAGLIDIFPGIRQMLEELRARGLKMGIVTQKGWESEVEGLRVGASHEARELGIDGFFSTGVGFESVTNHKPHPEGVLLALERLGADPGQCVVVGDTPADIGAAQAAGCWSCLATWGIPAANSSHAQTEADFVIDKPEALLELPILQ